MAKKYQHERKAFKAGAALGDAIIATASLSNSKAAYDFLSGVVTKLITAQRAKRNESKQKAAK